MYKVNGISNVDQLLLTYAHCLQNIIVYHKQNGDHVIRSVENVTNSISTLYNPTGHDKEAYGDAKAAYVIMAKKTCHISDNEFEEFMQAKADIEKYAIEDVIDFITSEEPDIGEISSQLIYHQILGVYSPINRQGKNNMIMKFYIRCRYAYEDESLDIFTRLIHKKAWEICETPKLSQYITSKIQC